MGSAQSTTSRSTQDLQIQYIDGGALNLSRGVYTAPQDWKKSVVRSLQLARRLAPFYKGLEDFNSNWSADRVLEELKATLPPTQHNLTMLSSSFDPNGTSDNYTVNSVRNDGHTIVKQLDVYDERSASAAHRSLISEECFGNLLYQHAVECPICFLFYPVNIATTRCCRQPICTECFVQIRRPNPHAPIVHADDPQPPPERPEALIMESPVCPYCNLPDFGVVYRAPDFGRPRQPFEALPASERDLPADHRDVVLTDQIRPDWAAKLQRAKDRAARRAANAALISAHLQRQERRAQDSRLRLNGVSRSRRRDYEALEEEQLAEAIRLSMLEDDERRAKIANSSINSRGSSDPVDFTGPPLFGTSIGLEDRIPGSMPMPELIYAPPPDSFKPGHSFEDADATKVNNGSSSQHE